MELAISAVTGELVSRFISFLSNKYHSSQDNSEKKQLERLQQLLLRARTVVEEADGRYITNSGMLAQLKMLAEAMYRGYWALGASRYRLLEEETPIEVEVCNSVRPKRSRTVHAVPRKKKARYLLELQGALESLESIVGNMRVFVLILGGCDRMVRRPYDAYIYIDNFMFGRHTEKQLLSKFLLQHDHHSAAPAVLPIIGALGVGKKTLVAHVCNDERVRSRFPVILHLRESDLSSTADQASLVLEKALLIVEFVSDVDEKDWSRFYSAVASLVDSGSKVVILSRHKSSERFGTVKPIFLNALSYEEFSYLFKTLAFGSENQLEHPRLVRIADEFARELQSDWSLVTANLIADVIRRDLVVHLWLCVLRRLRRDVEINLSMFGEHPKSLLERGHEIAVTGFVHPAAPLHLVWSSSSDVRVKKKLSKVTFHELLADPRVGRKVESRLLTWESRLPPYTSFDHFVSSGVQDMPGDTPLSQGKRRGVPL